MGPDGAPQAVANRPTASPSAAIRICIDRELYQQDAVMSIYVVQGSSVPRTGMLAPTINIHHEAFGCGNEGVKRSDDYPPSKERFESPTMTSVLATLGTTSIEVTSNAAFPPDGTKSRNVYAPPMMEPEES